MPGGFGKARETRQRGVYKVIVSAWHADIALSALLAARELVLSAMGYRQSDCQQVVTNAIDHLREMVDSLWLGPSTACIVEAAAKRGIPSTRLLAKGNLVQLGYGACSQRIWTAETDRTPAIAESISRDKDLTKELLRSCGVPVPEGRIVNSAEDAWEAAQDIGLPVVIKPCDGNHGRGVFIELSNRDEVEYAYSIARQEGNGVMVERYIPGTEHRLLVVGGRVIAASRGDSVSVIGDGEHDVRELIRDQINADPRRGRTEDHPLNLISLDSAAKMEIARQGLKVDSIPSGGQEVLIQRNGNHAFDVTDEVHPSISDAASLVARVIGLDIAGIDLVAKDISIPLAEQGGAIVEVNAGPSLLMHIKPAVGAPRAVGEAIVEHLFPSQCDARIPVIGITGSCGKTDVAHLIAHLLILSGKHVGLACDDGFYLDQRQVSKGNHANWETANSILMNRWVEAAVLVNGIDTMLEQGLAYDRCQVGIITNVAMARYSGRDTTETATEVFNLLRTQVDVVLPTGTAVLNAAEPMLVEMADLCDGKIIYFSMDSKLPVVIEHRLHGDRAVIVRDSKILLATGSSEVLLITLTDLPLSEGSRGVQEVENILAAAAAAWALGIDPHLIGDGIEDFLRGKAANRAGEANQGNQSLQFH
jgi:cyanophycin synthetase